MIAMIVAVIVLVATLLASIALMRSVDTANVVAGSMTFRQSLVQEAERAYEAAKANTVFSGSASEADNAASGYYAKIQTFSNTGIPTQLVSSDPTKIDSTKVATLTGTQNTIHYVVERLCPATGPADPKTCINPGASVLGGSSANQATDPSFGLTGGNAAFRLTVRVDGPKNTASFVQTILR
jgi:type II secretory pathway pseudopilin PulG